MNTEYQTSRLYLRLLTASSYKDVLAFQQRNREFFEPHEPAHEPDFYTPSHQQSILKCEYKLAMKFEMVRFYVFLKDDPAVIIGTASLNGITRGAYSCCELGYKFDYAYWHHGYAAEAAEKIIEVAFDDLELHRVYARVMPDNEPSIRLLERLGFEKEGMERESMAICGKWTDHLRYAKIAQI